MRTGVPVVVLALVAALTLSACGSSSTSSTTNAALATTTSSTSSTTTTSDQKPAKAHKKHKKTHKTTTTTTSSTTSKTTTSKTKTTTHTTTSKSTTTTAALKPPVVATLVGENHNPKIGTKWAYTVTAKDSTGRPLSGTIETEFTYGGAVVGTESPFKHQFTNGTITNKVTFPARSKGVTGLHLQVIVITSIGRKTLDWTVSPTTK